MSVDVTSDVSMGADDYQLIVPPAELDPRILVALARIVMEGSLSTKTHTTTMMALTVAAWLADHFLVDKVTPAPTPAPAPTPPQPLPPAPIPGPAPVPNPNTWTMSPTSEEPEVATLLHAAACLSARGEPVVGLPSGVQGALPPINWVKVLNVLIVILQQIAPFLGSAV